jgi:hypothetical protein
MMLADTGSRHCIERSRGLPPIWRSAAGFDETARGVPGEQMAHEWDAAK